MTKVPKAKEELKNNKYEDCRGIYYLLNSKH